MKELSDYNISVKTGCVLEHPLTRLPPSYGPWQDIMDNMWTLLEEKRVREKVHELPLLDTTELRTFEELCLAHLQLAMIGAAYIWQNGEKGASKVMPRPVAVPLWAVSEQLGLPPLMTYADICLMNSILDLDAPEDMALMDRLKHMYTFTPLKDWHTFICTAAAIETTFAKAYPLVIEAAKLSRETNCDVEQLKKLLEEIAEQVEAIKKLMMTYRGSLDPVVFFTKIIPYFAGWDNDSKVHPEGVVYEGVSDEPRHFTSASAGQSIVLQTGDFLLGNKHPEEVQQRLEVMRQHMLKGHREFLTDLRDYSKVHECVSSRQDPALNEAFDRLQLALQNFRSSHMGIVSSYVLTPSRKVYPPEAVEEDNKKLMGYLKAVRQSTTDHLIQNKTRNSAEKA